MDNNGEYTFLNTKAFDAFIEQKESILQRYNEINSTYDETVRTLLDNWIGRGADVFRSDAKKVKEKGFDLNDLLDQMKTIHKMGSMRSIMKLIPGANKITDEQLEQSEIQLKKTEAIINSMTKAEREKPQIIDPKRKRRIAAGSGTQVSDVNTLLKQFDDMQKMMKQYGLGGNLHGRKSRKNRAALLKGLGGGMPPKE